MFGFNEPKVPEVSAEELKQAMDSNQDCMIVDVRTEAEFLRGKLANSLHLPVERVATEIESMIPDKTTKVYVYCLSGSRSVVAVDAMMKLGYTDVHNLKQGLLAWRAKYFPMQV